MRILLLLIIITTALFAFYNASGVAGAISLFLFSAVILLSPRKPHPV